MSATCFLVNSWLIIVAVSVSSVTSMVSMASTEILRASFSEARQTILSCGRAAPVRCGRHGGGFCRVAHQFCPDTQRLLAVTHPLVSGGTHLLSALLPLLPSHLTTIGNCRLPGSHGLLETGSLFFVQSRELALKLSRHSVTARRLSLQRVADMVQLRLRGPVASS